MAIYITLAKFTDTGIKSIKDSPKRAQAFRDMAQKKGVKVLSIYWCLGQYDIVAIMEGEDEAVAAVGLTNGSLGSIRTETLRAMDAATFERVLQNVG
jgi:uncharacterized protein with GYD domain